MPRRLAVASVVLAFATVAAAPAEARSRFEFNGASDDAILLWDGAFSVATSNNECNLDPSQCFVQAILLANLGSFEYVVSGINNQPVPAFGSLSPYAILTFSQGTPIDSLCANPVPAIAVVCADSYEDLVNGMGGSNFVKGSYNGDFGDCGPGLFQQPCFQSGARYVALPFLGSFVANQAAAFSAEQLAFLAALSALAPSAHLGFYARYSFLEPGLHPFALELRPRDANPPAVPEPGTVLLLSTGLAALASRRRKSH